ncbi:MAG: hypothetical protein P8Y52_11730 [Xanthomonadales bacterium]
MKPSTALISMGMMSNAASATTPSMVAIAIGALRVLGNWMLPSDGRLHEQNVAGAELDVVESRRLALLLIVHAVEGQQAQAVAPAQAGIADAHPVQP